MKKRTLLAVFAISAINSMSACKKNYICYCDNSSKPATSYQFVVEHTTKKQATKECTAASNDDPTNQITCTINR